MGKAIVHGLFIAGATWANWLLAPNIPKISVQEAAQSGFDVFIPLLISVIIPTSIAYFLGVFANLLTSQSRS